MSISSFTPRPDENPSAHGFPDTPSLYAGLDVSTQSCKLVVIDTGAGAVLHTDRVEYDRDLPGYGTAGGVIPGLGEGVSESDPRMWIEAVETVLGRMTAAGLPTRAIRCLSVSGQQHGLVALDARGGLARLRSKLWNDFSTREECAFLTEAVGGPEAMIAEVGNSQRTGYTAPKILHLRRREPEVYARTRILFLVHNYVNWHLTGGAEGGVAAMEPGDASGTALWHPGRATWSRKVMAAIDSGLEERLPPVLPSDRTIGAVGPAIAERFGLSPHCRVDAGSGDNMYGAVGTGNVRPGILTVSLGTSGTAYTFLEEPFIDPTGEIAAFCDSTGHGLPLVCVSNMANGYEALRSRFGISHGTFDRLAGAAPPGNGGRVILPWYVGERTPDLPLAAPLTFGFDPGELLPEGVAKGEDFPPGDSRSEKPAPESWVRSLEALCRGVVEGHVLNLWEACSRLPMAAREIRVTGGLSASPVWCQTLADVFDAEVVPVRGEGAALGAALHAAWVWEKENGQERPLEAVVAGFLELDDPGRRRPDERYREARALLRRLYRSLALRVRGIQGEDPFVLRRALLAATPSVAYTSPT